MRRPFLFIPVLLFLIGGMFFPSQATAQSASTLVFDREGIFTAEEIGRIDSLLQDYHQRKGHFVAVISDTADVSVREYHNKVLAMVLQGAKPKTFAIVVLLSRRRGLVNLASNDFGKGPDLMKEFTDILAAGIPALKEKKREEGVTLMCLKAMQFLDQF